MKKIALCAGLLCSLVSIGQTEKVSYTDSWGKQGLELIECSKHYVRINVSLNDFHLSDVDVNNESFKNIHLAGNFLPNDAGMPNLPNIAKFIAIPQGASAEIKVLRYREESIDNINILPAPEIPKILQKAPVKIEKDTEVYSKDAFFPINPIQLSEQFQIRGVDIVTLGVTPFKYNPVKKELLVIRDVELEVRFVGGNGQFGDIAYRNKWFDAMLKNHIANYSSLPKVDYAAPEKLNGNGYEYVIITPDDADFISWADSIKEFRTLQGIKTGVFTITEIGGNTISAIETFINDAYAAWDTPPIAVLLLGDYGTSGNTIVSPVYNSYCASDNIYADIDQDHLPDLAIARITARDASELEVMVTKFINYEKNPPTDLAYYDKPITAIGWQDDRWFQICGESIGGYFRNELGKNPSRINEGGEGASTVWSTAVNTDMVVEYFGPNGLGYIPATPQELGGFGGGTNNDIINAINSGAFLALHRDHGGTDGWVHPSFTNTDVNSLTNINKPTFMFSINCLTGKYNMAGECFAEKIHRHQVGGIGAGALGVIAASESSYSFVNDTYVWGMFDYMWQDFMPDFSVVPGFNPTPSTVLPCFASVSGKYFLSYSNWPSNQNSKQVTYNLFHHHGDVFTSIFTEMPQQLTVAHSNKLFSGLSHFTVSADENSLIALTVNGEIIGRAIGTGVPLDIEIEPQAPGNNVIITISKQNYFRYQESITVIPTAGAYVVNDSIAINDEAGNNNQILDYGETVYLSMKVKNVGHEDASGVTVNISTEDPNITLIDSTEYFGDIDSNATAYIADCFQFAIADSIPDNYNITFTVNATDGDSSWLSYFGLTASAPCLAIGDLIIDDSETGNNDGILDQNETADIKIATLNSGGSDVSNVLGTLFTSSSDIIVNSCNFGPYSINSGVADTAIFNVTAADVPDGTIAELSINLTAGANNQYSAAENKIIEIGFVPIYCPSSGGCDEFINSVEVANINNASGGCDGYADYTDVVGDVYLGESYNITVDVGNAYDSDKVTVWVDWNYNGSFEDPGEEFPLAFSFPVASGTIVVPDNITPRELRMRVKLAWGYAPEPCGSVSFGETEDYTLNVMGGAIAGTATANPDVVCTGGSTSLSLSGYYGDLIQWQESNDGNNWVDIDGANEETYTTPNLNETTYYRAMVSVTGFDPAYSNAIEISVFAEPIASFTYSINGMEVSFTNTSENADSFIWDFGDGIGTSAEENPAYEYAEQGSYNVELTASNLYCPENTISSLVNIGSLNISKLKQYNISIYPNPNKGIFNIDMQEDNVKVEIMNIEGKVIYSNIAENKSLLVNISNQPIGLYLIKFYLEEDVVITKVMKE